MSIYFVKKKFSDLSKEELYTILKFRMEIFILEQKSIYLDLDDADQEAMHFLGMEGEQLKAYGRVHIDPVGTSAFIRRVAVEKSLRFKNIGSCLMTKMLHFIDSIPDIKVTQLDAQHHLQSFYMKHGFKTVGKPYDDGGILHIDMVRE